MKNAQLYINDDIYPFSSCVAGSYKSFGLEKHRNFARYRYQLYISAKCLPFPNCPIDMISHDNCELSNKTLFTTHEKGLKNKDGTDKWKWSSSGHHWGGRAFTANWLWIVKVFCQNGSEIFAMFCVDCWGLQNVTSKFKVCATVVEKHSRRKSTNT